MCVSARPRESRVQTVILGQKWAGRCRRRSLVPHLLASVAFAEYHPDTRSSGTYQYYIPAARGRFCLQRGVLTLATLARLTTSCATSAQSATLLTATKQLRGSGSKRTRVVVLSAKAHRPESRAAAASVLWPARRDRWRSRDDARSCVSVGPAPRAAVPSKGDSIGRVSGNSKATGLAESYAWRPLERRRLGVSSLLPTHRTQNQGFGHTRQCVFRA